MSRTTLVAAIGTAALLAVACSSSKATSGGSSSAPAPAARTSSQASSSSAPVTSAATTTASSRATVRAAGLSGTWNGKYSGSFNGTFVLTWSQSGAKLSGTIKLSTPPTTVPINGTVSGGQIQFGTVGSTAITYTGLASGSSMSGHYQVGGGAAGSGSWSATKG